MNEAQLRINVLISIQQALWGMIYPSIRAIAVGFKGGQKLTVMYYLDREPNEDDYENISEVTTEILADINFSEVEELCKYTDEQINCLNNFDSWVYIRQEFIV